MSGAKLLILILVLCLIIAFAYQGADYFKQQKEQANIIGQMNTSVQTLAMQAKPPQDLNKRLEEAKLANQISVQFVTGNTVNSTEIINNVLQTADTCDLKTSPLTTNQWLKKSVGGSTYRMLPIEMNIDGKLSDLTFFMEKLSDKNFFPSLAIEDLSITGNEKFDGEDTRISETSIVSAKLKMSIVMRMATAN